MARIGLVAVVAVLALAGCSEQPAEVSVNDQVPAAMRTEAPVEGAEGEAEGTEGAEGEAGGDENTFVAVDIDFTAAPEMLSPGDVQITLVNEGAALHNVAFDEVNDGAPVVEAEGGQTAQGTVQLEPGEYTYFCSVPGHRPAGMEGTLTVPEA